jgi:error-prone DNA polymerase
MMEGKLQRESEVIHVIVQHCYDLSKMLRLPATALLRSDEKPIPMHAQGKQAGKKNFFHKRRDFK